MPMFTITNPSRGQKLVQVESSGKKRKQIPIPGGATKTLPMSAEVAQRYMQAAARNPKYLQFTPADTEARAAVSGKDQTAVVAQNEDGAAAAELLDRADVIPVEQLRTEARMVLAGRWPRRGGNDLTREQIKELLQVPKE